MTETRFYLAQRLSAAVMAPLVLIHLGVMIYAIQGGLDAAENGAEIVTVQPLGVPTEGFKLIGQWLDFHHVV